MKPKYNSVKFRNLTLGATTAIVVCFSSNAIAADNFWSGATSTDWNDATNWSLAHVPAGDNAFVNTSGPNIATISAAPSATPVDIFVGNGSGNTGVLNHTAGLASTGPGNWMFVGRNGGIGTYNLGVPGGGGAVSGLGEGSGSMSGIGRLYIGGYEGTGSTGTVNMNSSGTVSVATMVEIGTNTSSGTLNIDKGVINNGTADQDSWFEVGNGVGSTGVLNMTGGQINKIGNQHFVVGTNGATSGTLTMSGGAISVNNEIWIGDFTGSTGTVNLNNGTITLNSWFAVGRRSGSGTLTLKGGSITKTGGGNITIGTGTGGSGTIDQQGGTITNTTSSTFIGEGWEWNGAGTGIGNGQWTISGGEAVLGPIIMGNGGASIGSFNLNGGTLTTTIISDNTTGATNFNFNGGTLKAGADQPSLMAGLDAATVKSNGAVINTNGFNVGIPQALLDGGGGGGLTKKGAGKLTLSSLDTYTGGNSVLEGLLILNTGSLGEGDITLANSAALGLAFSNFLDTKLSANVTFGTGNTVDFSVGDLAGSNSTNPLLDVTGNLSLAGNVIVNLAGSKLQATDLPLVSFVPANRSGVGNFVLGNLPPGVVATIVEDADYQGSGVGMIYLDITSVALPEWNGTNETLLATTGDTITASFDVIVSDATGILVGQTVRGDGIPAGAKVASIAGTTITLDMAATATATFVDLDFVSVAGTADGVWDTTTTNWIDQVSFLPTKYADPNPALFSDLAEGPTAVSLAITVKPSVVTFNNSVLDYSLAGGGKISDPTGGASNLTKSGTAALTVSTVNDYTGVTTLAGGTTTVTGLTNGGVASPLGAASAAPANLVFAGGTLALTGVTPTTIDRGLTITGASGLNLASDLTITGQTLRSGGGILKSGAGVLKFTNAGPNGLGDLGMNGGGVILDGSGAPQVDTAANIDVATVTGSSSLTLLGNTTLTTPNRVMTGQNVADAVGAIVVSGTSQFNMTGGWLSIGQTGDGSLTVKDSGSFSMTGSDFNITDLNNSKGTLNLQDNGKISAVWTYWGKNPGTVATINISGGTFTTSADHYTASGNGSKATVTQTGGIVNMNGGYNPIGREGEAVWNLSAGTVNSNGWSILGRDTTGNGTLDVSGGTYNQTQLDRPLMVGEFGQGFLIVSGTGQVNSLGANGLLLGNEASGAGTVNLNGGTLTVRRVLKNTGGATFHFNGGLLKAGANANLDFMNGLTNAFVEPGGAFIDTNGQTIAIGQVLRASDIGEGDLTKQGAGTLLLNGSNGYEGTTTVEAGTIGGTGALAGPLAVPTGTTLAPGVAAGTFTVDGAVTLGGTYACDLDGANADRLTAFGPLTLSAGAVLDFSQISPPTAPVYVVASFASRSGTFIEQDVPAGYTVVYNAKDISLVQTSTPYGTWASTYFPGETNPAIVGPTADPDGDGSSNATEFALGGAPNSGSNNPKIYNLVADGSGDVDTQNEFLMTIAVRSGTPVFAGTPSPTATTEGITYTIQGSANLSTFTAGVTAVAPVTTGLPAVPAGYEYRTFSLDNSNGTPAKGFLRVQIK